MRSTLTPVDEAIASLQARARTMVGIEQVSISEAEGRYLAEDIVSSINVPPHDNSAMDGYAVRAADVAPGSLLSVSDRIPAGTVGQPLAAGTVARIFTGAPIPERADAVVIQENTGLVGDLVQVNSTPTSGDNIRLAGQDIAAGAVVVSKGRRLKPQDIGLIASVGCHQVSVFKRLKVGVMSTGDELVDPPAALAPGQIYNSNHYTLQALLRTLDMEPVDLGMVADTAAATEAALQNGVDRADCILSSGGVSVGEEDHVKAAIEKLGALELWRLAIKPGKPLAFGRVATTPFFGLPGNPVSGFVTFMLIARVFLLRCQGATEFPLTTISGVATFTATGGSRREYIRVRAKYEDGKTMIEDFGNQGSGVMSSLSWADGLAVLDIDTTIKPGDPIQVLLLP